MDCSKVIATVTDNGSNFTKSFKEFRVSLSAVDDVDEESDNPFEEEVEFIKLRNERVSSQEKTEIVINHHLPNHVRCASHTLHLIATTDVKNAICSNHVLRN